MKSKRFLLALAGVGLSVVLLINCSKEDSEELAQKEVAVAQDSESQDAVSENITQSVDNNMDALEANNFSGLKSSPLGYGVNVTIDKADTVNFPKTITLTYNIDTIVNGEQMSQTGEIKIMVELTQNKKPWKNYVKRTITFSETNPFTVATDSFSVSISGTRVMTRKAVSLKLIDNTNIRLAILDTIVSNLKFKVTSGDYNGEFTRVVNKSREAIAYFGKPGIFWRQNHQKDTLRYKGNVQGVNLRGDQYSRNITKPVVFTVCPVLPFNPVVSQGEIELKNGSDEATLKYSADGCKTKVVISKDGASKEISRKLNHRFYKWW